MRGAALILRGLELKVPPLAVVAITALLMGLCARAAPSLTYAIVGRPFVAAGVAAAGLAVIAWGLISFRRAGTSVNPMKPGGSSSLVAVGPYVYSRNPMYVGMLLWLVAWAVWLGNALAGALLPAFVVYLNRFQIAPEERTMGALFGADYDAYCRRVRRWL